jgi:hypothetical protein
VSKLAVQKIPWVWQPIFVEVVKTMALEINCLITYVIQRLFNKTVKKMVKLRLRDWQLSWRLELSLLSSWVPFLLWTHVKRLVCFLRVWLTGFQGFKFVFFSSTQQDTCNFKSGILPENLVSHIFIFSFTNDWSFISIHGVSSACSSVNICYVSVDFFVRSVRFIMYLNLTFCQHILNIEWPRVKTSYFNWQRGMKHMR